MTMTFDPYANQGGSAAWDADAAAATKKAGEKLFAEADDDIEVDDVVTKRDAKPEREEQPEEQPGNVPDPDITVDR